jgi:Ca2+/Na+ antiporter
MRDGYKQENSSLLVTTHYVVVVVVVHNILFSMDRDIFFLYFILFYFLLFIIYLLCELVEYDGQASRHQGCVPFVYPVIPICAIWNCLRDQPTERFCLLVFSLYPRRQDQCKHSKW